MHDVNPLRLGFLVSRVDFGTVLGVKAVAQNFLNNRDIVLMYENDI